LVILLSNLDEFVAFETDLLIIFTLDSFNQVFFIKSTRHTLHECQADHDAFLGFIEHVGQPFLDGHNDGTRVGHESVGGHDEQHFDAFGTLNNPFERQVDQYVDFGALRVEHARKVDQLQAVESRLFRLTWPSHTRRHKRVAVRLVRYDGTIRDRLAVLEGYHDLVHAKLVCDALIFFGFLFRHELTFLAFKGTEKRAFARPARSDYNQAIFVFKSAFVDLILHLLKTLFESVHAFTKFRYIFLFKLNFVLQQFF